MTLVRSQATRATKSRQEIDNDGSSVLSLPELKDRIRGFPKWAGPLRTRTGWHYTGLWRCLHSGVTFRCGYEASARRVTVRRLNHGTYDPVGQDWSITSRSMRSILPRTAIALNPARHSTCFDHVGAAAGTTNIVTVNSTYINMVDIAATTMRSGQSSGATNRIGPAKGSGGPAWATSTEAKFTMYSARQHAGAEAWDDVAKRTFMWNFPKMGEPQCSPKILEPLLRGPPKTILILGNLHVHYSLELASLTHLLLEHSYVTWSQMGVFQN